MEIVLAFPWDGVFAIPFVSFGLAAIVLWLFFVRVVKEIF